MVRTVRSMEEEARVKQVAGPGTDEVLADAGLLDALEGAVVERVVAWSTDNCRRALVVGLEDRGRIALALVKAGLFVTVVEPDESLHGPVLAAAEEAKCSIRLNFYASDYMKREFATSGFDAAIFFSTLSRYNEPVVVLKKAARELRAGGRVFARVRVRPPTAAVTAAIARVPKATPVWEKVVELAGRVPAVGAFLARPDAGLFLEDVAEVFKVERVEREHLVAPALAWLSRRAGGAGPVLLKALPAAVRADAAILGTNRADALATHVLVYGLKELGLGKTFRV